MADFLIDIPVLLQAALNQDLQDVEKMFFDTPHHSFYITASMIPAVDSFMRKNNLDKDNFNKNIIGKCTIITSTGREAARALEYEESESALNAISFKRVCPNGIIITTNKDVFSAFGLVSYTPEEALFSLEEETLESKKTISLLDLSAYYRFQMEAIDDSILDCIVKARYILGPQVNELETKLSHYLDVENCIGVCSGTDALVLALRALAIQQKNQEYFDRTDAIITTPFTFTATGDAILRAGATPVFVDIDPVTYNIAPAQLESFLKAPPGNLKPVGILPVHLYGQACNMEWIMYIAQKYNLFVVEDVAQAIGGMWKKQKLGTIGNAGAFSFFPSKNLGGFGDGGMVATNDGQLAQLVRMLLKHGGKDKYNVDHIGYNARLDTIQASVLLEKLPYLDEMNQQRRAIADRYTQALFGIKGIQLPLCPNPDAYHVYHQYTVCLLDGNRDALQTHLKEKGISTMIYYPFPLHKMRVFQDGRSQVFRTLNEVEKTVQRVLSLPVDPLQSPKDTHRVIQGIKEFFEL